MVTPDLARHFDGPFVWGASDCCTCACDAFAEAWGIDPMQPQRGRYYSAREAMHLIDAWGGWRQMFGRLARRSGLVLDETGQHLPGALGLAWNAGRPALVFAAPGGLWLGKIDGGFATTQGVVMSCRS
jgi:hypothetical protein